MSQFDQLANEWDSPQKIKLITTLAQKTKRTFPLKNDLDILDFGCGTGLFGMEFLEKAKSITGIDTSDGMLEVFKSKVRNIPCETFNVDIEKETINKKFDLIVSSMAFHHVENPRVAFNQLYSMLNNGGQIFIVDLEKEDGTFHPDPEKVGVKHFGFSNEEIQSWSEGLHLNVTIQTIN